MVIKTFQMLGGASKIKTVVSLKTLAGNKLVSNRCVASAKTVGKRTEGSLSHTGESLIRKRKDRSHPVIGGWS